MGAIVLTTSQTWVAPYSANVVISPATSSGADTGPAIDSVTQGNSYIVTIGSLPGTTTITADSGTIITGEGNLTIQRACVSAMSADGNSTYVYLAPGAVPNSTQWDGGDGDQFDYLYNFLTSPDDASWVQSPGNPTFSAATHIVDMDFSVAGGGESQFFMFDPITDGGNGPGILACVSPVNSVNGTLAIESQPTLQLGTAPTLSTGTITQTSIVLNWTTAAGVDVAYQIYSAADGYTTPIYDGQATTFTVTGLTKGTTYHFKALAYNLAGAGVRSNAFAVATTSSAVARLHLSLGLGLGVYSG